MLQDLRHSLRQLWRRPAFTATAVLTLAVGIGVNAVAFSVVNGLLFKSLATKTHDDVGRVVLTPGGDEGGYGSLPDFRRYSAGTQDALDLGAEGRSTLAWRLGTESKTAWVLFVTRNYFSMVSPRLVAGRALVTPAASAGSPTVVISERFWREKLSSAPVADLALRFNNLDVAVAGIMAESFTGPAGLYSPDVWLPIDDLERFDAPVRLHATETRWLFLFGRLGPGVTPSAVQGRLDVVSADLAREWPETHRKRGASFRLFSEGNSERRGLAIGATIGMSLIGLVLLLACFNVATLLLARGVERERDMGIRAAFGGSPSRLIRLVAFEGMWISAAAGLVVVGVASMTQALVTSFAIPIEQPQHIDFTLDGRVLTFIAVLVAVAGVLPGLWPALAAGRLDVLRVLRSQGGGSPSGRPTRLRRALVAAQVAGSTAFLAIAALFVQSVSVLVDTNFGFDHQRLVVADIEPQSSGLDAAAAVRYVDALVARAGTLPGVTHAAVVDRAPFFIGFDRLTSVWPARAPCPADSCPQVPTIAAGPGYFETMGIAMAEGREFAPAAPTTEVIVNQPFATQQWGSGRGLGEVLRLGNQGQPAVVIGVTAKHHTRGLDREQPTIYVPLTSAGRAEGVTVVVRAATDPVQVVRALQNAAHDLDPVVSLGAAKTMTGRMAVQLWPFRTMRSVFAICGLLALLLATAGLASLVIHAVNRRLREFGVRASIGASPRDLRRHVLGDALRLFAPGVIAGVLLAAIAAQLVRVVFFGVNVLNPATYLVVAIIEGLVVTVACLAPARRAARVDPLIALRSE
jgi:putative ABC transport system permease protein